MMKTAKIDRKLAKSFNHSVRHIDDLLTINNNGLMKKYMNDLYPKEFDLKHENRGNDKTASYLDLTLDITNKEMIKSLYGTTLPYGMVTKWYLVLLLLLLPSKKSYYYR